MIVKPTAISVPAARFLDLIFHLVAQEWMWGLAG